MTTMPRALPDDTLAAASTIADHFDHFFRTVFAADDVLKTPRCFRYVTGEPHPFGNMAIFSRDAGASDVSRDAALLRDGAFPSAIIFLDDGTPEQVGAVTDLGFMPAERMPAMSVTPDTLAPTELPEGFTLREITPDDAEAWAVAVSDGYGLPLGVGSLFGVDRAEERAPGATAFYTVEHKGTMVATSLVYLHDGLAGVYGVATLPEHRGKGLGAHLTAEPLRRAWSRGYTTGILQASEMGAPVYTRIGFRTHGHLALFVHVPG